MTDAFGAITWWGFSPSLDLQQKNINVAFKDMSFTDSEDDALNVLIVGAGDCRHILKTIAQSYRHRPRKINFYVLENNLEVYARTMLLMGIALEPPARMGLQDKTELFLEIFGNSLVRQQCMDYVHTCSNEFIKMVTDFDYLEKKMPFFDLSLLKFKERDFLEGIFKFWRNRDKRVIDIAQAWDLRVRQHLGVRYDAIPNVFDWDCTMKLAERGADIIHHRQYAYWRKDGLAFQIREGTYDVPNLTLVSGLVIRHEGERYPRRGYWGDIIVSPYICYGIECEDRSFFKKSNNMYTKTASDVSEYNVLSLFYELAHKEKYVKTEKEEEKEEPPQPKLQEITEEDEEEAEEETTAPPTGETTNNEPTQQPEFAPMPIENTRIFFLPLGSLPDLHKKSKYTKLFNMVYMSNSMVHLLKPDLVETVADKATLILETAKFMLELDKAKYLEYHKKVTSMACDVGFKPASDNVDKDPFARFTFTRQPAKDS